MLHYPSSPTPVTAIKLDHSKTQALIVWLKPFQNIPYPVLATLSDGEVAIIEAMERQISQINQGKQRQYTSEYRQVKHRYRKTLT